ncbi:DNA-binding protein [Aerosakkonemataceae cyanobacterium BLCC-F50]|uniref:DNA-binding protein n=1 Tax=Floridaenema flaviceps BLCC-F50 TaxID=3153642 RepID=A0ABV4XKH6_9CYAN
MILKIDRTKQTKVQNNTGLETMVRSINYENELIESIQEPLEAAAYIEACLEEAEPKILRLALKDIVEAHQRMNQLSEKAKLLYGKFDRMLSENKGEEIYCFSALLDALGFQFTVTIKSNNKERVTQKKVYEY